MRKALAVTTAFAFFISAVAVPSPAKAADPWWFLAGIVVGAVTAPAYGYPFGYRSGYAPVAPVAPWAATPPQECHWARVQHNGAWRHARICYEGGPVVSEIVPGGEAIIRK